MNDWVDNPNVTDQTRNAVEWGKKVERERIVALLEMANAKYDWHGGNCRLCEAIALIKGETE